MSHLPILDLSIIAVYLAAMILIGFYFSRSNKSSERFTKDSVDCRDGYQKDVEAELIR